MRDSDIDVLSANGLQHGPQPHAPAPHPYEYRGTSTCDQCGCLWHCFDISAPNPVEDWCKEPQKGRPDGLGCACHSWGWLKGYMDEQDRIEAERAARS